MLTKKVPKVPKMFNCNYCDYNTSRKSQIDRHKLTAKHINLTSVNSLLTTHICDICSKEYNSRVGLWGHKKNCTENEKSSKSSILENSTVSIENMTITPELIINIIQQNQEFKNILLEQNKQMIQLSNKCCGTINNNNTNNSHNKTFNLQLYLNETCKDAMNIMEFVDSIKFQLSDLESIGELGYINGLSKVIIRNLNALDENMRPVHCSDLKRAKIYVKDAGKWEKEGADNKILKNAIKYIAHKNVKMIPAFREKYPDCVYSDSRKSDQYNRLIIEAMGGDGNDEDGKANKIIKRIAKEILIDK